MATTTGDCGGDRVGTVEVLDLSFSGVFAHPASFVLGNLLKKDSGFDDDTRTRSECTGNCICTDRALDPSAVRGTGSGITEVPAFIQETGGSEFVHLSGTLMG